MVAALKLRSSWAATVVPLAANIASPRTRSRRLSEPCSKRVTRLEMIDSMAASLAPNFVLDLRLDGEIIGWNPAVSTHTRVRDRGRRHCGYTKLLASRYPRCYPG